MARTPLQSGPWAMSIHAIGQGWVRLRQLNIVRSMLSVPAAG